MPGCRQLNTKVAAVRILHLLDHSLPMHSGYTFRTRAILKAQAARGWQVAGVTGVRHTAKPCDARSPDQERIDGLDFHRTPPVDARLPLLRELAEVRALATAADRAAAGIGADLLHAHSPVLNALAAWRVARRRRLPFVYEIRAFWEDAAVGNGTDREGSARYRATRALESWVARRADAVVVICEGLRADLVARGVAAEKISVVPNGVDLTLFGDPAPRDEALGQAFGIGADADVVGFIGSFYDYEGLDDLIAAMPMLLAERPNAHLLLVGGGPMEEALREQAAASRAAFRIHFAGRVAHDQVERYYSLIDVLAYPRKAMRLTDLVTPLKPLEAMAQRRLVAASDVGGHRELIRGGVTGTLFPADDPAALADALVDLLADRAGWDARRDAARAYVEQERDWARNVARYEPIYRKLAQPRPEPAMKAEEEPQDVQPMDAMPMDAMPMDAMPAEPTPVDPPPAKPGPRPMTAARRLAELRFDAPLAALFGAAVAFAGFAMPARLAAPFALPQAATVARLGWSLPAGLAAGLVLWLLLRALGRPARRRADGVVNVRRADAHPDAPPRPPIFAARDLGEPLMDAPIGERISARPPAALGMVPANAAPVPVAEAPVAEAPAAGVARPAEPAPAPAAAELPELPAHEEPAEAAAPWPQPRAAPGLAVDAAMAEDGDDTLELTHVVADDDPILAGLDAPAAAEAISAGPAPLASATITTLMDRLKEGLARRAGQPAAPRRRPDEALRPVLRETLTDLDRRAAGRG